MQLIAIRKTQKIKVKDIPLHPKTVKLIEEGKKSVSLEAFETYCNAIGLKIILIDKDINTQ